MEKKAYKFSSKQMIKEILYGFGLTVIVSLLFYRSIWGFMLFPMVIWIMHKRIKAKELEKQREELEAQFMNGMRVLNASLQAGLSMENAWREVQKETLLMYGKEAVFFQELQEINHSVEMNIPLEKSILDFAYRSEIDDIISFAEIFDYGKRSGGNWKRIIDTTFSHINEKYEARKEIQVMVASKKLEQQVMNAIPLGILAFLQFSSWEYMRVLYHNPLGVFCMTIGLVGYSLAILLSEKILRIQV